MATQTLLTPTVIAREALRLLKNNLVMGNLVHRAYEAEFPGKPKVGGSVTIRKPVRFKVKKTRIRSTATITEQSITLSVATQAHVSWNFFSVDLTLTIEEYSERYIRPAAAALANQVDADLCALYDEVPNIVAEATTGAHDDYYVSAVTTNPSTFLVLGRAMQKMDEEAVPPDERVIVLNPAAHWSFANALSNWNFKEGGADALRKGHLGRIANAEIYMDQNIKTHTVGSWATDTSAAATVSRICIASSADSGAGGGLPTGAGVGVSQNQKLLISGFLQDSVTGLLVGDVFTINGCNAVNPMSGESIGTRRFFVINSTPDTISDDSTGKPAVLDFRPEMIHTGPYKTVDTIPQLGARLNVVGAPGVNYAQNLAFHRNAFALVMVPLEVPDGQWSSTATEDGCSCRVVKDYDIDVDSEIIRLDILYGVKTLYPELAVRIAGAEA